jgi:type I restriction enzyme S subunit
VYECFRVKPPHEPRFMGLLMESGLLTAYFDSTAVGSIQRRRRTTVPVFLAADATLPDPDTQRRIVDLIVAMDAQIEALDAEIASSKILLGCLLNEPWQESKSRISVGAMADLASGPSWAATDESPTPTATGVPVVKITNTRPDGRLDLSERIYVKGLPPRTRVLDDRSLIAIRTNGNRERIGNVYRPSEAVMGSAVSAFQFIVQCQTTDDRDYLYWLLRAPTCQRLMSDAASGSTGLGNLGARWLRALEIPWSEKPERRELLARVTAVAEVLDALTAEGESLSALRRTLLMALLSGEVEIRASNPRLVEAL